MKTVFPVHVTVVRAETGQTVLDQIFSVPKHVDLHYLSIAAHKRLRQNEHQYRTDLGDTIATRMRENRPRTKESTEEDEMVRKFLRFVP